MAGWHEYAPFHPRRWEDTDPATSDPAKRLAVMDEYGIHAQVLYPNVAVFDARTILAMNEPELQLSLIRSYNDYLSDLAAFAPGRYIPASSLPFWDLDETLAEIDRCAAHGHKGDRVHPGPELLRAAGAHRPLLGSVVGVGAGEGDAGQLPHRVR